MARSNNHPTPISQRRRKAVRRRLESLLSDSKGWPQETAPLRVRARVMSNLAAQRQDETASDRAPRHVTMYRESGWSGRKLQFSLRPPLAAAAVIAMIVSAAVHLMGGTEAWQPWADGLASHFYDVNEGGSAYQGSFLADAASGTGGTDVGRDEAEALFSDVARFRDHIAGRIPTGESAPKRETPQQSPPPSRRNDPEPSSS